MDGILVAADVTVEWMLPWWWEHYRKHNSHPAAFIDLGMSPEQKKWCKKRGRSIPLRIVDFAAEEKDVDPALAKQWNDEFGKTYHWEFRNAWFKKPFACLQSPFDRTIWFDLDCEIRGAVDSLFNYPFAVARDYKQPPSDYPIFNGGVIAFHRDHPLLKDWAEHCRLLHGQFRSDQEVLSYLIAEKKADITILPPRFNWSRKIKENPEIVVLHWHGSFGKSVIKSQIESTSLHDIFSNSF